MLGQVDVLQIVEIQVRARNGGGHGAVGADGENVQRIVSGADGVVDGGLSHGVVGLIHEGQLHAQLGLHSQIALVDGVGDDTVAQLLADELVIAAGLLDVENVDLCAAVVQLSGQIADIVEILGLALGLGLGGGFYRVGVLVTGTAGGHGKKHEGGQHQCQQLDKGRSHGNVLLIFDIYPL